MCVGFGGVNGALFLSVGDFASLWYLGVGDEEDGVGRCETAYFSLGKVVKVVRVGSVPCFGVRASRQRWVLLGLSFYCVDHRVCVGVCVGWGCGAFGHGSGGDCYGGLVGVWICWDTVNGVYTQP